MKQREIPLTTREKEALGECFGLIKSVAWKYRSWVPDLESELMLQAVRIMPGWDGKRALGPFLQASLSRYCINLLRDKKDRERTETDESGGAEDSILDKAFAPDQEPIDNLIESEDACENWGDGSSNVPRLSVKGWNSLDPDKPTQEPPKRASGKAARWVKKNGHLLGQWRGWAFLERQSGLSRDELSKALEKAGYSPPVAKTKRKPKPVSKGLFDDQEQCQMTDNEISKFNEICKAIYLHRTPMYNKERDKAWQLFEKASLVGFPKVLVELARVKREVRGAIKAGSLSALGTSL